MRLLTEKIQGMWLSHWLTLNMCMRPCKFVISTILVTRVKISRIFKLLFLMLKLIKQHTINLLIAASIQRDKHTHRLEMKQILQAIRKQVLQVKNSQPQEIVILRGINKFQQQLMQLKRHRVFLVKVLLVKNLLNFKVEPTTTTWNVSLKSLILMVQLLQNSMLLIHHKLTILQHQILVLKMYLSTHLFIQVK